MTYQELLSLTSDELSSKLEEQKKTLQQLYFSRTMKALESPMNIRELRRNIARIKTAQNSKKLGIIKSSNKKQAS